MSLPTHLALALVGGPLLWVAGTFVFDVVHCALHQMLGSRFALLRALAWPHGVHHRWLDAELRIHPELQRANVFCHLIPEFLTQLAFSLGLLLFLPVGPAAVCIGLQTLVFAYLLAQRGLDLNHRPIALLDAYRPGFFCPPTYHALHHVYPTAHFSAYTKLVDWLVGGASQVAGRRYAVVGSNTRVGQTLRGALQHAGAQRVEAIESPGAIPQDLDVLILADPTFPLAHWAEAFIAATRTRQLPPELWSLGTNARDVTARHYQRDVRLNHRLLYAPDPERSNAHRALFWIRRGAHFVPLCNPIQAWPALRRFCATKAEAPQNALRVRSRNAAAAT